MIGPGDAPRRRVSLPNGSLILVERTPKAKTVVVSLWANARNFAEKPETSGVRHLLEHLMAVGPKGDVDRRLESVGAYLTASTARETMNFKIVAPAGRLDVALDVIRDVVGTPNLDPARVQREKRILAEEFALRSFAARASAEAWKAFGRPDPIGDPVALANSTVNLLDVYRKQFSAPNLVLSIAGDVDLDRAASTAKGFMSVMPDREADIDAVVWKSPASGSEPDLAVEVGAYDAIPTAATLAAGLALAAEVDGGFTLYTPSAERSLVVVGSRTESRNLLKLARQRDIDRLFASGLALAKAWIAARMDGPEAIADARGSLACLRRDLRPEAMESALANVTVTDFVEACRKFAPERPGGGR